MRHTVLLRVEAVAPGRPAVSDGNQGVRERTADETIAAARAGSEGSP